MIVGTAGHIDHGKSRLVEALTGRSMDRLPDERRRGITIDLNFASLDLGTGRVAAVVDVPGHEDLVRTMVAGASGMDVALLVVAATEGVMPQTLEHLAILEQLHVPLVIPVLTKVDLVDPEWCDLVALETDEQLRRFSVPLAPTIRTSAETGEGLDALRDALLRLDVGRRSDAADDLFRLPVDRAFSLSGIGTVVTGAVWSGTLASGSAAVVLPLGRRVKVRAIQSHGRDVVRALPGTRVALAVAGVDRAEVSRGDVVVEADAPWRATTLLDAMVHLLGSSPKALAPRSRIRVLLGSAEVMARVRAARSLEPGETGPARLVLERPLVARAGDRFVLRSFSPVATIGGGEVIDPLPSGRKPRWDPALAGGELDRRIVAHAERRGGWVEAEQLALLVGTSPAAATAAAESSALLRRIGSHWVAAATWDRLAAESRERVRRHHRRAPLEPGISLETLRRSLGTPPWLADAVLARLAAEGALRLRDGIAALPAHDPSKSPEARSLETVVTAVLSAGLAPPTVDELERQLGGAKLDGVLRLAARAGRLEAVERDRYYAREALERFTAALRQAGADGVITPGRLRDVLGISRKYLIPLLEWADAKGITTRSGDARTLRK